MTASEEIATNYPSESTMPTIQRNKPKEGNLMTNQSTDISRPGGQMTNQSTDKSRLEGTQMTVTKELAPTTSEGTAMLTTSFTDNNHPVNSNCTYLHNNHKLSECLNDNLSENLSESLNDSLSENLSEYLNEGKGQELREYQKGLMQQVSAEYHRGNRRVKLQLPTGGGKTVIFAEIIAKCVQKQIPVLVIVHREELLVQAKQKIEERTELRVGIIKAGHRADATCLVQVASIQTLIRRKKGWPEATLLVVDESHHSSARSYTKVFQHYSDAWVLGVTATPCRSDGQGFKYLYDKLITGPSVEDLIQQGYLSPFKLFAAKKSIDTSGVQKQAGEFNPKQLAEAVDKSLLMGDVVQTWCKHALGKKTAVFAIDVAHSQEIAQAFTEAGIPAEHLDGTTPVEERRAILNRFRKGETLVLCNCGIVTEGFDVPSIEAIQCVRPTASTGLWLQMVGRGLRTAPGKQHALIIDHTKNWLTHGLPDETRDWSLDPISLSPKAKWVLQCPDCEHVFRPLPHEKTALKANCPNCAEVIDLEVERRRREGLAHPSKTVTHVASELEEITSKCRPEVAAAIGEIVESRKRKGYQKMWAFHRLIERHLDVNFVEIRALVKAVDGHFRWANHLWDEVEAKRAGGAA